MLDDAGIDYEVFLHSYANTSFGAAEVTLLEADVMARSELVRTPHHLKRMDLVTNKRL